MKRLATIFLFLGFAAIAVGVGLLVRDYRTPSSTYDPYGYNGEVAHEGYASLIRFLSWIFGGVLALAASAYFRSIHKRKHHAHTTA